MRRRRRRRGEAEAEEKEEADQNEMDGGEVDGNDDGYTNINAFANLCSWSLLEGFLNHLDLLGPCWELPEPS